MGMVVSWGCCFFFWKKKVEFVDVENIHWGAMGAKTGGVNL